jgi:hypothetical protein
MASSVGLAAVIDVADSHEAGLLVNLIQDTLVTHADAPGRRLVVAEHQTTRWTWILGKSINRRGHAVRHLPRQFAEITLGAAGSD